MGYPHYPSECIEYHSLIVDFDGPKPPIAVLCGSTRFYEGFQRANLQLTLDGVIVLSIGCDTKADNELFSDVDAVKAKLDELHKRKIDMADFVYVITDEEGYLGESTLDEIAYAEHRHKPISFWVGGQVRDAL